MKMKKFLVLAAALTVSAAFVLNGCGFGAPSSTDNTSLSAETEQLTDGSVELHSRWYNDQSGKLASATVTFAQNGTQIYQGTTDENGNLAACTIPGNTEITCTVTDAAGTALAESTVIYKISAEYQNLSIVPASEEEEFQTIEVPASQESINAALFVTADKAVSHANLSPYQSEADATPSDTAQDGAAQDGTAADDAAQTQSTQ